MVCKGRFARGVFASTPSSRYLPGQDQLRFCDLNVCHRQLEDRTKSGWYPSGLDHALKAYPGITSWVALGGCERPKRSRRSLHTRVAGSPLRCALSKTFPGRVREAADPSATLSPDFLWNLVALISSGALFSTESRMRGSRECREAGNLGTLQVGMTRGRGRFPSLGMK